MSLQSLPTEIQAIVFPRMLISQLVELQTVCKAWRNIIWQSQYDLSVLITVPASVLSRLKALRKLELRHYSYDDSQITNMPRMVRASRPRNRFRNIPVQEILRQLLAGGGLRSLTHLHTLDLTHLHFVYPSEETYALIAQVVTEIPHLRTLYCSISVLHKLPANSRLVNIYPQFGYAETYIDIETLDALEISKFVNARIIRLDKRLVYPYRGCKKQHSPAKFKSSFASNNPELEELDFRIIGHILATTKDELDAGFTFLQGLPKLRRIIIWADDFVKFVKHSLGEPDIQFYITPSDEFTLAAIQYIERQPDWLQALLASAVYIGDRTTTLMNEATVSGNRDLVIRLLRLGVDVNVQSTTGTTGLHLTKDPTTMRMLLERGANPNLQADDLSTPFSALFSDLHSAKDLLPAISTMCEFKANPNIPDSYGRVILHKMFSTRLSLCLDREVFIKHFEALRDQCTSLRWDYPSVGGITAAVMAMELEMNVPWSAAPDTLFERGLATGKININHRNIYTGDTLLHRFASKADLVAFTSADHLLRILGILIRARADFTVKNVAGWTPVAVMIQQTLKEDLIFAMAEACPAALVIPNHMNMSALDLAANPPNYEDPSRLPIQVDIAKRLLRLVFEAGIEICFPDRPTPLMRSILSSPLCMPMVTGFLDLATYNHNDKLLHHHVNYATTIRGRSGWTALHLACVWSEMTIPNLDVVRKLLAAGADVNAITSDGYNPLMTFESSKVMLGIKGQRGADIKTALLEAGAQDPGFVKEPNIPWEYMVY